MLFGIVYSYNGRFGIIRRARGILNHLKVNVQPAFNLFLLSDLYNVIGNTLNKGLLMNKHQHW